jgi:hypothetical protein
MKNLIKLKQAVKVKVNLSLFLINQAPRHEDVWESGGTAQPLLNSVLDRGEWSASRPCRFTPKERAPRYELNRRLSGPKSRSARCREE